MSKKKNTVEGANAPETAKKKKRLSAPRIIALSVLGLLLLALLFGCFTLAKCYGMSCNAVNTVDKPDIDDPYGNGTDPGVKIIEGDELNNIDLTVDHDDELDPKLIYNDPIWAEAQIDPDITNILLLGDDAGSESGRADSMMILSYNRKTGDVKMLSLLRDTWVYLPGRATWSRLNTAYRYGGVGLAVNTVNTVFNLDIQYYMLVTFDDIRAIVDTVGGLDVPLDQNEVEYINANSGSSSELKPIPEGREKEVRHLDGLQAACHSRNRKVGNGDWSRTERQRSVMKGFYARAAKEKNAASLASLMYKLMDHVKTNMSPWEMISLATDIVFGGGHADPQSASIPFPGTWAYAYDGSTAVIHIDIEKNREEIHKFIFGK